MEMIRAIQSKKASGHGLTKAKSRQNTKTRMHRHNIRYAIQRRTRTLKHKKARLLRHIQANPMDKVAKRALIHVNEEL